MKSAKMYMIIGGILISMIFAIFGWIGWHRYQQTEIAWKQAVNNEKAYEYRYNQSRDENREFLMTIDQLTSSQDSIVQELEKTRKELRIRDKNLAQLEYIYSEFSTRDTLKLVDTIFIDELCIDTTTGDEWIYNHLHLHYPNVIEIETNAKSKKNVIISTKKETVNPPSKWFFIRWFQKKHEVIKVDVEEKNPHIKSEENVFIRIVD